LYQLLDMVDRFDPHHPILYGKKCQSAHHEETLLAHSIQVAMIASTCAYAYGESEDIQFASYVTGLFHDIGKHATVDLLDPKKSQTLHFMGHDVVGAGILNLLYAPNMGISDNTWDAITTAIRLHMSGYHGNDATKWKWMAYQSISDLTSRLLVYLRRGDLRGKTPGIPQERVLQDESDFHDTVRAQVTLPAMYRTLNLEGGVLILLCGRSGSGKTTLGKRIQDHFHQQQDKRPAVTVVRRDEILVNTCFRRMGRARSDNFANDYAVAYKYYTDQGKEPAAEINAHMAKQIESNLCERKVVVVDSVMCMYKAVCSLLGPWANASLQYWLLPLRNKVLDDVRHKGLSLSEQMRIFGDRDALCPVPTDIDGGLFQPSPGKVTLDVPWNGATDHILCRYLDDIQEMYQNDLFPGHLLPTLADLAHMDLHQVVTYLYHRNQIDPFFRRYQYHVKWLSSSSSSSSSSYDIVGIRYIDGINHLWKYPWTLQARGTFFILDHDLQQVYTTKQLLPRGLEVATHQQIERFRIQSTQDVHDLSTDFEILQDTFGTSLASTLDLFRQGGSFSTDTYVSFKADGSLVAVNLIPRDTHPRMVSLLEDYLVGLGGLGAQFVKESQTYPFLAVISSNGTLVIPDVMVPYYTSAYRGSSQVGHSATTSFIKSILSDASVFLKTYCSADNIVSLSFEAICPQRTDPSGTFHPELAVNYEQYHFRFLGCTRFKATAMGSFYPHFLFSTPQWEQPLSRSIQNTVELTELLNELESAYKDPRAFLRTYFGVDCADEIDYEGFVLYMKETTNDDDDGDTYSYYKAKTSTYYRLHQIKHKESIDDLLTLPRGMDRIYPALGMIRGICEGYQKIIDCVRYIFDHELNEIANDDTVIGMLPERAQKGLRKQTNTSTRVRILVNNKDTLNFLCQQYITRILSQVIQGVGENCDWLMPPETQTQFVHDWFMDIAKYGDIQHKTLDALLNQGLNGTVVYFSE
jgi:energy-coupling factor transporter ATP-binding protein EcfA2